MCHYSGADVTAQRFSRASSESREGGSRCAARSGSIRAPSRRYDALDRIEDDHR
jgi:hypothetical protein